jgi:hypothetical protein
MDELFSHPRDVSYLKKDLPLTEPILQQFEIKWFEACQLRDQGKSTTRVDLEIAALITAATVVGIPEIAFSFTKEAIRCATVKKT